MELEGLLNGNQILVYFIGIFYILINEALDKKQKIIMIYIFTYTLKLFNIIDLKIMLIVSNVVAFIYIGFLSKDNLKNNILCNIWDKIKDYSYKCIFEYSSIYYLLSVFLISNMLQSKIPLLQIVNIDINLLKIKINIISLVILGYTLNNITSQKYETNTFQMIKDSMNKVAIWSNCAKDDIDTEKLNMLVDIEDKSYFFRKSSYNFLSIEFFQYKIKRKIKEQSEIFKDKNISLLLKKKHLKLILSKLKKGIRGYSTIEMQIIRTLGVKYGYSQHVVCRKIYELVYSKMFFTSLRKYMNKLYLDTSGCCSFKEYLLIVYIGIAPIQINNKRYKNMLKPWNKNNLKEVSKEEFFISILGLSNRWISKKILYNYSNIINKYNLETRKLEQIIEVINKE